MNTYKQVINYQKRQKRDLEVDLPLVHLLINFKSYLGNDKPMFRVMEKIYEFRKQGLAPEYRIRMFIISQEYYLKCYKQTPWEGHITYYDSMDKRYKSKHVTRYDNDNREQLPF